MASKAETKAEHLDVLVVGAGISGIGAGCYLKDRLPDKSFAILEGRESLGGTWDLFRYPGIRSDSDLNTFGYEFEPWRDKQSIADAPLILSYLRETSVKYGVAEHIRYSHRVIAMNRSAADGHWVVQVERGADAERITLTANWVFAATATTGTTRASPRRFPVENASAAASSTRSTGRRISTTPASGSS